MEEINDREEDLHVLSDITGELKLKEYCNNQVIDETSRFAIVTCSSGKEKIVRKSSIVWLLTNTKNKLSSDRLLRVQQNELKRKRLYAVEDDDVIILDEINVNEWCIFRSGVNNHLILGLVLNFKYMSGKTNKQKQYSREYAPVKYNGDLLNQKGIAVIATFYKLNERGQLKIYYEEPEIKIETYLCTIRRPKFTNNLMILSESQMTKITNICMFK